MEDQKEVAAASSTGEEEGVVSTENVAKKVMETTTATGDGGVNRNEAKSKAGKMTTDRLYKEAAYRRQRMEEWRHLQSRRRNDDLSMLQSSERTNELYLDAARRRKE